MTTMQEAVDSARAEFEKEQIKVNLAVVGGTGVGKSSLINHIFGKDVAPVGNSEPQTRGINKIPSDTQPIVFFDTEGYEISADGVDNSNFQNKVLPELASYREAGIESEIHLVWYCISVTGNRITPYDIENIKSLKNTLNCPVQVVITKAELDELDAEDNGVFAQALKAELKANGLGAVEVFETSTQDGHELQVQELITRSSESLTDDKIRLAFVASQRRNIEEKRKVARNYIIAASGAAASAGGFNPFPGSDAAIIGPIQVGLSVKLVHLFGFGGFQNTVMAVLKSSILPMVGKLTAASLTKLIPVAGQFINAAVAGTLTAATGFALERILSKAYMDYVETGKEPAWSTILSSEAVQDAVKAGKAQAKQEDIPRTEGL